MTRLLRKAMGGFGIVFLMFACNTNTHEITDKYGKNITRNVLVENQVASKDSSVSYAYYLPEKYDGKTKVPVLFILDAHADVKTPINKYQTLANTYGYIFIGSQNIKNGMSGFESQKHINILIKEAKKRFVIDEKRMFVSGFSGGAKLAISFAQQIPDLIGVIACGGSIPLMVSEKPTYYYAGVVGNQDFNFLEVQQTYSVFDKQGLDFTSIVFNGAHEWPPAKSYEMALASMNIYAMKTKRLVKDNKWLDLFYQRMLDSVQSQKSRNDLLLAHQTVSQAIRWFNGLHSLKELNNLALQIRQNPKLSQQMQKTQQLIRKEVQLRSAFIKAIQTQDISWWKSEVEKINQSTAVKNKLQAQVSQRLLNYLSMACFMLAKTDLDDVNLDNAIKKIHIYELVDPDNYDVYLMYARFYMLNGDTDKMNAYYKKAQNLGFVNNDIYAKDVSWKKLMEQV